MVWCSNCVKNVAGSRNEAGFLYCNACGKVLDFFNFSDEPTFTKDASGQSQFSGNFVKTIQSDFSASRERTLNKAMEEIRYMRNGLNMGDNEEIVRVACAFYRIAVERNFTRGRNSEHVQASCLYIACREKNKPYLLIDFSNYLRINVYVLGAVFLQLCKVLRLEEHPIVQKPVDPSLFIDKFTQGFLGGKEVENKKEISRTASKIISSMKRDWMQTGRKPSGLCGAALYISAVAHGVKCAKSDIVRIVHICDATLTKRLIEFENTESGSLTMEEFILMADKAKENGYSKLLAVGSNDGLNGSSKNEVLCIHKDECERPFALGLCRACYDDFMELSGGIDGGADPPAFQRAERERLAKSAAEEGNIIDANVVTMTSQEHNHSKKGEEGLNNVYVTSKLQSTDAEINGLVDEQTVIDEATNDEINGSAGMAPSDSNETDNFSDIDDVEVDGYLHNEEEKRYKKIIWEEMNKEYLEEQAAKEAAAKAAKSAQEAHFQNCSSDLLAAKELAAATSAAVAKSRKERQQKRAAEAKNESPAQTAAEATRQMLTKKRLSSRINYDVLEKLFDESEVPETKTKKQKEMFSENKGKHYTDKEKLESVDAHQGEEDEYDEDHVEGEYDTNLYGDNIDDAHYYNDDDYANDDYTNDDYE